MGNHAGGALDTGGDTMITPERLAEPGTEAAHQTALFCWAALNTYKWPELAYMFAIPNGGTRNKVEAGFLKAQGVRAGVPDVFLPVARWGKHGLWIELKVGNNLPSAYQRQWIETLLRSGYSVQLAYSWTEARDVIIDYLEDTLHGTGDA